MLLHNKVIFITDADSLSGKALIRRCTEHGASFILNSVSDGADIQQELSQIPAAQVFLTNTNLCSSRELSAMLEQAEARLGAVSVLIHNNDYQKAVTIESCEEAEFLDILNRNAKSAFLCTQAAGKQMATAKSGSIIYVSSIHAEKPTGSSWAYSASKGAVKMLAKEAALILGRSGITVNTIELGPLAGDNERFHSGISTLYEDYEYKVPNAVLGSVEDLASLALFLASDQARYLNGADIRLDGGFLLHYMDFKMKRP